MPTHHAGMKDFPTLPTLCCHRTSMAVLKASGDNIRDYLQGQITQDITLLSPEHPIYTAVLSPQGKIITDMYLSDQGNELIMVTAADHAITLVERLRRFAMGHDIRLGQVEALGILSVQGEKVDHIIQSISQKVPIEAVIQINEAADQGAWLIIKQEDLPIALTAASSVCSDESMESACIAYGTPRFGRDWDNTIYPLNANLIEMHGVSFDKGCYVGQEVTSRMQWRGGIKKKLYRVQVQGELPLAPTPIQTTNNIGMLTAVTTNIEGQHIGIAHLPIETVEKKTALSLKNGDTVIVIEPCHA